MADSIPKWNRIIVFKYSNQIQTNFQLFIIKLFLIIILSIDLSSCKPYNRRDIGPKTSLRSAQNSFNSLNSFYETFYPSDINFHTNQVIFS